MRHVARLTRLAAALTLGLTTLLLPVEQVVACDCAVSGIDDALARADAAFAGTVVSVEQVPAEKAMPATFFTFEVDGVAKGTVGATHPVLSMGDGASCGTTFGLGERWLVFATYDGPTLTTGLCSGNVLLGPDEAPPLAMTAPAQGLAEPDGFGIPAPLLLAGGAALVIGLVSLIAFRLGDRRQVS